MYVPKGLIACLKVCMHRTVFWGGVTSGIIFSTEYVSMTWLYSDNNGSNLQYKNKGLLQAHYYALVYLNWHKILYNTHLTNRMVFLASLFFVYVVTMEWI
jgi:hypothetical protein